MLVEILEQVQKQRELTNAEFAKNLGIQKRSWIRNKRTNIIDATTLLRAFEVYPEFRDIFLASFGKKDSTRPETSCSGKLARFTHWIRGFVR